MPLHHQHNATGSSALCQHSSQALQPQKGRIRTLISQWMFASPQGLQSLLPWWLEASKVQQELLLEEGSEERCAARQGEEQETAAKGPARSHFLRKYYVIKLQSGSPSTIRLQMLEKL